MNEDDKEKEIKSSPYNYNTQHNLADHSPRYTKKKKKKGSCPAVDGWYLLCQPQLSTCPQIKDRSQPSLMTNERVS